MCSKRDAAMAKLTQGPASIISHLHVAELLLYESALQEAQAASVHSASLRQDGGIPNGVTGPVPSQELLTMLWACAAVVRAFLTNRFAHKTGDYPRFVCMSSLDFTYAFLTMLKLITLRLPGWDLRKVRAELDFESTYTMRHCAKSARTY